MFKEFFEKYPDYTIIQKPEQSIIKTFDGKLPLQLIDFWRAYGFGIFMNGYLKIVNPTEFQPVFDTAYDNTDDEIVFAITAMGDFLTWTGDAIRAVYFKNGYHKIIESGDDMEWFFNMDLADEGFMQENLNDEIYKKAKEKFGKISFDECFGYEPILSAGGSEEIENLKIVKLKEHISIITMFSGKL